MSATYLFVTHATVTLRCDSDSQLLRWGRKLMHADIGADVDIIENCLVVYVWADAVTELWTILHLLEPWHGQVEVRGTNDAELDAMHIVLSGYLLGSCA